MSIGVEPNEGQRDPVNGALLLICVVLVSALVGALFVMQGSASRVEP